MNALTKLCSFCVYLFHTSTHMFVFCFFRKWASSIVLRNICSWEMAALRAVSIVRNIVSTIGCLTNKRVYKCRDCFLGNFWSQACMVGSFDPLQTIYEKFHTKIWP